MNEKEEENLKNCPFCNGIAIVSTDLRFGYTIRCRKCGASTKRFEYLEDAKEAWNRRKGKKDDRE